MLETYKLFRKSLRENYARMTNEELVKAYRESVSENERSQTYCALFVNNFPALLKVTSKYSDIDSSEKAGMVSAELLRTIQDYNFKNKFITYLITRMENMFLWNYTNNKNRRDFDSSMRSLNEKVDDSNSESAEIGDNIEDKRSTYAYLSEEFKQDVKKAFVTELLSYRNTPDYKKMLEQLRFDFSVLRIMYNNPDFSSDQIARKLGLFTRKEEYENKPNNPDYFYEKKVGENGEVVVIEKVVTRVRKAQWGKIIDSKKRIRDLLVKYGICADYFS